MQSLAKILQWFPIDSPIVIGKHLSHLQGVATWNPWKKRERESHNSCSMEHDDIFPAQNGPEKKKLLLRILGVSYKLSPIFFSGCVKNPSHFFHGFFWGLPRAGSISKSPHPCLQNIAHRRLCRHIHSHLRWGEMQEGEKLPDQKNLWPMWDSYDIKV